MRLFAKLTELMTYGTGLVQPAASPMHFLTPALHPLPCRSIGFGVCSRQPCYHHGKKCYRERRGTVKAGLGPVPHS